ncbi:MAG: uridine kinase [Gammaproteobacteria bacterium]|nr:uridine kinase [Gammaproteobacteria bacterium]
MKVIVISVAGGSGSGKTTVVNKIISCFKKREVRVIRLDDYYKKLDLPFEERVKVNYDHPNSLDFDLFISQVKDLCAGKAINKPLYDYVLHQRKEETELIEPSKIIILEGILVLESPLVRELSDIKIFVDTDTDLRFIRRMLRDTKERGRTVEGVVTQYLETVKPMHEAFVEPTKKYADIIIPNDYSHDVAANMIITKIHEILEDKNS